MKKLILGLSLSLLADSAMAGGFVDKINRFSSVRTVSWSRDIGHSGEFGFSVSAYIASDKKSALYDLTLITVSDHWRYMRCNSTAWLVDGKAAPYIRSDYKSSMGDSSTIEMLQATLSLADLTKLAAARTIEYQVCNDEGSLTPSDIDGIRKVLSAVK